MLQCSEMRGPAPSSQRGSYLTWVDARPGGRLPSCGRNRQEATHDELIVSLTATLREALDLNREDALAAAGDMCSEAKIAARSGASSSRISVPTLVTCREKAAAIHGGTTRFSTSARRCPGMSRSATTSPGRSVATSACLPCGDSLPEGIRRKRTRHRPWREAPSPGAGDAPFTGRNSGSRRAACRPYSFAAFMAASMILLWIQ